MTYFLQSERISILTTSSAAGSSTGSKTEKVDTSNLSRGITTERFILISLTDE